MGVFDIHRPMTTRRFFAENATAALELVRESAGDDALILDSQASAAGVEIRAVPRATGAKAVDPSSALFEELAEVRSLIKAHFGSEPARVEPPSERNRLMHRLLSAGLSSKLCEELADEGSIKQVESLLASRVSTLEARDFFDAGGVYAFIGPTGVGKTTAIAKIAARCALRYGRDQVALVAMDSFRIGAHDQLKAYAEIIGVPVVIAQDNADLEQKIRSVSGRKVLLVDTAGVNQRDVQMLEQLQRLDQCMKAPSRILVMSGTSNLLTLEDVILMHERTLEGEGPSIHAAIITKTDEAAQLGPVLDCLVRHELPLLFIGHGQRVPEDLGAADVRYLCERALNPRPLGEPIGIDRPGSLTPKLDTLEGWR